MSDDDNVRSIGIQWKSPAGDTDRPTLSVVRGGGCNHAYVYERGGMRDAHYLIREGETDVECGLCGTKLDPMFVLIRLAQKESNWRRAREVYQDEMKRLAERKATKCDHCGKMTRISRAKRRAAK